MTRSAMLTTASLLVLLFHLLHAHSLPDPSYVASAPQHARAVAAADAYIRTFQGDDDTRMGVLPLYRYHPPGAMVHGTVVLWYANFSTSQNIAMLGQYLYENDFNVFMAPFARHSLSAQRWPYALLRDEMGGTDAKNVLLADPFIRSLSEGIKNGTLGLPVHRPDGFEVDTMIDRVLKLFREKLTPMQNRNILKAFELLVRDDYYPGLEKDLELYFESDHERYDSLAYHQLSVVAALPGPLYTGGFSVSALMAIFGTARSKRVERTVLLAPNFEPAAPEGKPEYRYLLEALGVLDLYEAPLPGNRTGLSRVVPAADLAGRFAMQDEITRNIRENTASFCVYAEDDTMADFETGINVCRNDLRNNGSVAFAFPAEDEIGPFVAPGLQNKYSAAMAKEILRFFAAGSVHTENLRTVNGDPELPPIPPLDSTFVSDGVSLSNSVDDEHADMSSSGAGHSHVMSTPQETSPEDFLDMDADDTDASGSMHSMGGSR